MTKASEIIRRSSVFARGSITSLTILGLAWFSGATALPAEPFDIVLTNGRVMDPESGLDAVRHLGIRGGTVAAVSETPLSGRATIDATGRVVAPGFIDLNTYQHGDPFFRLRAADGVTSVLYLEDGAVDVAAYYDALKDRALIHHGIAVGHGSLRHVAAGDTTLVIEDGVAESGGAPELSYRPLTDDELDELAKLVEKGLRDGAVAVGFGIEYAPGATHSEILRMLEIAERYRASAHLHLRKWDKTQDWGQFFEVFGGAIHTGGDLHINHLQSIAGSYTGASLDLIDRARSYGLSITAECYPYTAGLTFIESTLFDNWEAWPDDRFQRYEWPATGERLTREAFARYRKQGGVVTIHPRDEARQEAAVRTCLTHPLPMIASDGAWDDGKTHPRSAGTNSRVLGHYVRDEGVLPLMEALRKMSLAPAQHLERRVPAMARKGRIRVGADADLVVFNPATVIDRATYSKSTLPPVGIETVLVGGVPVLQDGAIQDDVFPGRAIRAPSSGIGASTARHDEHSLLITGVSIVDVAAEAVLPPQDILIEGGKIARIAKAGTIPPERATSVLPAAGNFAMPGLIDVHAHLGDGGLGDQSEQDRENALAQFLRYGVTTIFVPGGGGGNDDQLARWKERCRTGELACPGLYGSGALITAPGSHPIATIWDLPADVDPAVVYARGAVAVAEDEPVDSLLDRKLTLGADGIKIIIEDWAGEVPRLSAAKIAQLVEASHERDLKVFAHVSLPDHVADGVAAGIDGVMHSAEEPIPDTVLADMAERQIFYVATLALYDRFFDLAHGRLEQESYARAGVSQRALESLEGFRGTPFETPEIARPVEAAVSDNLRRAAATGVPLALGTDVNNPQVFPGYSAHEELALMVEAGLNPQQALRAATLGSAAFLGQETNLGRIAPGYEADLLILARNPLEDVRGTRSLVAVLSDGVLVEGIVSTRPQHFSAKKTAKSRLARIDDVVSDHMKERRIPGASIAVITEEGVAKTAAYGTAVIQHDTPAKVDTVYEIASLTKHFTAAAVLMLCDEGKLSLDEPISRYIEAAPAAWRDITLRNLLTHTAGLASEDRTSSPVTAACGLKTPTGPTPCSTRATTPSVSRAMPNAWCSADPRRATSSRQPGSTKPGRTIRARISPPRVLRRSRHQGVKDPRRSDRDLRGQSRGLQNTARLFDLNAGG